MEEAREIGKAHSFQEVIVLTPVVGSLTSADFHSNRIYTVGSQDQLEHLLTQVRNIGEVRNPIQVLFKCASTMKRFGMSPTEMKQAKKRLNEWNRTENIRIDIRGFAIHFPQERIRGEDQIRQIRDWIATLQQMDIPCETMYVSHLSPAVYRKICEAYPAIRFVMRVGTDLWLNDRKAFSVRSTVVDVRPLARGQRYGYKQRRAWRSGFLVTVSGGTAHGIGLAAPTHVKGIVDWVKLTAFWVLSLFNLHLSPFSYRGKRFWFAEPPHMQTSMLKLSGTKDVPEIGEELSLQVRMTTSLFDQYVITNPLPETELQAAAVLREKEVVTTSV